MKNLTSKSILTLILILIIFPVFSQGVKISTTGGNPDGSAILEIESTNRGLLIPRMTTAQRTSIVTPAQGLLVFDSSLGSFFIYGKNYEGKTGWIDLSSDAGLWTKNASSVYLTNSTYNIGVGTDSPTGKFVVQANNELTETDILFEVKDKFGKTIFEVTSAGVK
ncbi:MAG: hypothetical protein L3J35_13550, partial [Bacteroidales bacterium]|nr:hypothetical protein [Bacteroidales bacterium]